jgi:hypothetical protein
LSATGKYQGHDSHSDEFHELVHASPRFLAFFGGSGNGD